MVGEGPLRTPANSKNSSILLYMSFNSSRFPYVTYHPKSPDRGVTCLGRPCSGRPPAALAAPWRSGAVWRGVAPAPPLGLVCGGGPSGRPPAAALAAASRRWIVVVGRARLTWTCATELLYKLRTRVLYELIPASRIVKISLSASVATRELNRLVFSSFNERVVF